MKILNSVLARLVSLALLWMVFAGSALAQFTSIEGDVRDLEGKPFVGVVIEVRHKDTGQTLNATTDSRGQFVVSGLRSGVWMLSVKVKGQVAHERNIMVSLSPMERININFKDLMAKQTAEQAAARKKQEEETKKFEGMKGHFDAGRAQLEQAIAARNDLPKTPPAERGPVTEKLAQSSLAAINEFEAAKSAAAENDPNLHIVTYNLGQAYDIAGRYDEAVTAYLKAIELKGDVPGYYQALGTAQARAGKVADAMATCEKAATLPAAPGAAGSDPAAVTAACYGNVGIILQNSAKMKESIEPLKKATALNPNFADYWFLLGRGLANDMSSKMEGGKMIAIIQPGTAEAYQKYLDLAPTGRFAQEAKDGLETLKLLGVAIDTKITTKKAKKP